MELAATTERTRQQAALNTIAKRLRLQRVELLQRLTKYEDTLSNLMEPMGDILARHIERHATIGGLKSINERIRHASMVMRRTIQSLMLAIVKDTTKMALRHAGNALLPIFQDNQESVRTMMVEAALAEARLTFKLDKKFANRTDPRVALTSDKWKGKQSAIVKRIAKGTISGLKPSDRIWEISRQAEVDMRRIVSSGVAAGEHPSTIARKIKKYVSPAKTQLADAPGRGVYRSPFKNAMRLARTEALRAYNTASAEFAKDKPWNKGMQATLSPNHEGPDVCDENAGKVFTPEEFAETYPLHPHCMCYGTYIIDPKFLGE